MVINRMISGSVSAQSPSRNTMSPMKVSRRIPEESGRSRAVDNRAKTRRFRESSGD